MTPPREAGQPIPGRRIGAPRGPHGAGDCTTWVRVACGDSTAEDAGECADPGEDAPAT